MHHLLLIPFFMFSVLAAASETPLLISFDSGAQYLVLNKTNMGAERTIVTKRIGSSGTTYSRRLCNGKTDTVKYLGTGDSIAAMNASRPDPNMSPIFHESIAYYIGIFACK